MKKLSVLIAMLLVFALAVPTFAATFSDVPSDHWAYDAINKLVASGVIEGYPDGTYKGQRNMSRYEMAVIISRALDNIAEERNALREEVGALDSEVGDLSDEVAALKEDDDEVTGLTSEQAKDVTAIVKALMEKNMPEAPEVPELPEGLTDEQAEEVANLIEALTFEFKAELKTLGAKMDALGDSMSEDIDELEARVAALEEPNVSFSGEYGVDYTEIVIDGTGPDGLYPVDPYDFDPDDYDEDDDVYEEELTFEQTLDMDIGINSGPLSADVTLSGHGDPFDGAYDDEENPHFFVLDDVYAEITGPDFAATIGEEQELTLKDYLYDGSLDDDDDPEYPVNGVIVEALGNTYVLSNGSNDLPVMAGTESVSLAGVDLNFGFGLEDGLSEDRTSVVGVDTTLDMGDFEITPTLAVSNLEFEERYLTLNANGDLGPVATTFNYKNIDGFEAIEADVSDTEGFDVEGKMDVGPAEVTAYYESYDDVPYTKLVGEVAEDDAVVFGPGLNVYGDAGYRSYLDVTDATSTLFNLYTDKEMRDGDLTLGAALEYEETTNAFEIEYDDTDEFEETDVFDKILTADYVVSDALSVGAELTFDVDNELSHLYTADYEQGIVTAGLEKYIDTEDNATILTAGLDPETYNVFNVSLDPYADFGYRMDDVDNYMNYAFGVDATKELTSRATLTGNLEYADKEFDVDYTGTKFSKGLGFEYVITDDVSATADYMDLDFTGDNDADSYNVKKATAGVSVSF